MTTASPFAGTWKLQNWTSLKNGKPSGYPMGEDARGQIIYADDGYMSAFLMRADFPMRAQLGTPDTCLSYGGTWHYVDGCITHEVTFSNLSSYIGRRLVRRVERDQDIMTLRTEPEFSKSGSRYDHILIFRRADAG